MNARINTDGFESVELTGFSSFAGNSYRQETTNLPRKTSAASLQSSIAPLQNYSDFHLTNREKQVLALIARGYTNKYAARELKISPHTIAGHIKEIYRKLYIGSRAEATIVAIKLGLLDKALLVTEQPESF